MKESKFQQQVIQFLKDNKVWYVKYWAGSKFTSEGVPDLLVCIDGTFHGIELKNDDYYESKLQAYNMGLINSNDGEGYILRPTKIKKNKYPEFNYYQLTFEEWKARWFR